jgi:hypothetical protein
MKFLLGLCDWLQTPVSAVWHSRCFIYTKNQHVHDVLSSAPTVNLQRHYVALAEGELLWRPFCPSVAWPICRICWETDNERYGWVVSIFTSYPWGSAFKSRLGDGAIWLRRFVKFAPSFQAIQVSWIAVFWDLTSCSLIKRFWYFGETYCFNLYGRIILLP